MENCSCKENKFQLSFSEEDLKESVSVFDGVDLDFESDDEDEPPPCPRYDAEHVFLSHIHAEGSLNILVEESRSFFKQCQERKTLPLFLRDVKLNLVGGKKLAQNRLLLKA
jgi:hypothetical protein